MNDILRPNGTPARHLSIVMPDGQEKHVEQPHPKVPHQLQVYGEGQDQKFRWVRNDGKAKSPMFTTIQEALFYAGTIPLLTRDEWQQLEIPPEWLALNEQKPPPIE